MMFYKRYIGAFVRKTMHLSLVERGAYNLLLDHYYATERPLPDDMTVLCRVVGAMSEEERGAVARVADEFFPINGDGLRHNHRADEEIANARALSESARKAANTRWEKRAEGAG